MHDKRSELMIALIISTPKVDEIIKRANELGLSSKDEITSISEVVPLCLKDFYPDYNEGFLQTEIFKARMDFVSAAARPIWGCLWEDQSKMLMWTAHDLVFKEVFDDKFENEYILIFKFINEDWIFSFQNLKKYRFSEKDRAVCLA